MQLAQPISALLVEEESLRDSEERLRDFLENAHDLIQSVGPDGRFRFVNRAWQEAIGYSAEEAARLTIFDVIAAEAHEHCRILFGRVLAGATVKVKVPFVTKAGRHILVEGNVNCRLDCDGRPISTRGIFRDISERKRAEELARAGARRQEALAAALSEMVWHTGPQGEAIDVNHRWLELTGQTPAELAGQGWLEALHPDDRATTDDLWKTALATGQPYEAAFRVRRPDGSWRHMLARGMPVRDDADQIKEWVGVLLDITKTKESERAVREAMDQVQASKHMLETVLNNIPQGVFWKDRQSRYLGCNAVVSRAFGQGEPEQMIGKTDHALACLKEEQAAFFIQMDQEIMASEQPVLGIIEQATLANGSTIWMETNKVPMRDPLGQVVGILGTWQDITERKSLEEQLRLSQKMEAFGQLAGGVAHDFNNLLTVISGFSEILLSQLSSQHPMRALVKAISEAGDRAASLTRQLLAFSRQTVLETKVFDLNSVVSETEKMLRRLIGEDVVLTAALDPNLRPMKADPGQLGQVLMNLAVNARDAMPKGGQLIIETGMATLDQSYADAHPEMPPGRYIKLTVSDTGCGMSPEVQRRIFEPFFTTKGVGAGTGLGMAVVHGIVKQSGGGIEVHSEPGVGTTFKIYFPAADEVSAVPASKHAEKAGRGTETVLLVEDEDGVRGLAHVVLQSYGYTVLEARSGIEALRKVEEHRGHIDLLVSDVVMPEMDGPDLADAMRTRCAHLKVLFLSGYTNDAVMRRGILHDDVAFLQKPFSTLALARKVREVLDKHD